MFSTTVPNSSAAWIGLWRRPRLPFFSSVWFYRRRLCYSNCCFVIFVSALGEHTIREIIEPLPFFSFSLYHGIAFAISMYVRCTKPKVHTLRCIIITCLCISTQLRIIHISRLKLNCTVEWKWLLYWENYSCNLVFSKKNSWKLQFIFYNLMTLYMRKTCSARKQRCISIL